MCNAVVITDEMFQRALEEAEKRNPYIKHHFELNYMSAETRDVVGFIGEFACCELFGVDWKRNIRENYYSIDSGDITINGNVIDVKTETIPLRNLNKIISKKISDDEPYGRRLINDEQIPLLSKYRLVVFGAFAREECVNGHRPQKWYPLGYLPVKRILNKYSPTQETPFGTSYPTPVLNIKTSDLFNIERFLQYTPNRRYSSPHL